MRRGVVREVLLVDADLPADDPQALFKLGELALGALDVDICSADAARLAGRQPT
jgi:hypothetical protein